MTGIAIVDTGVANTASVLYALERLGASSQLTRNPEVISRSSHVILPGVGTAMASMDRLRATELDACIRELKQPVLGICLGMQLLFEESEEGHVKCLGVLPGVVKRMQVRLPVPHMGWNQIRKTGESRLLKGIQEDSYFYFVHSFVAPSEGLSAQSAIKAIADYEICIPAVVESDNWYGTQFHPERSGEIGQTLLRNFINI